MVCKFLLSLSLSLSCSVTAQNFNEVLRWEVSLFFCSVILLSSKVAKVKETPFFDFIHQLVQHFF